MTHLLLAALVTATGVTSGTTSPSQLAFAGTRSFGLHGCDPAVEPPAESATYCTSVLAKNRTHRNFGDRIQGCLDHRVDGPPLDPDTELSFFVARGTVNELACQLSTLLEVRVQPEPDAGGLILSGVHWLGLLNEAHDQLIKTEGGTLVRIIIDSEKKSILLVRVVGATR